MVMSGNLKLTLGQFLIYSLFFSCLVRLSVSLIIAYPAAGQPVTAANRFAKELEQMCRAGMVNIVGGCCGTTPEYTAQISKMAARWRPHKFEKRG